MKILVVSEVFWPENFLVNDLVRTWKSQGHTVDILTQYPSYPESHVFEGYENKGEMTEEWEGSKIFRFRFIEGYKDSIVRKFANYLLFVFKGQRIARRVGQGYDVVFVSQTGPLTVALPALAAKRKWKMPVAILTLDIWPDVLYSFGIPKNKFTEWLIARFVRYVYRNCDEIFVSSQRFKENIRRFADRDSIYAPNWLQQSDEVESTLRLDAAQTNITFTGNISRYQNLLNVVKGFEKAALPNAVLNIVGDGSKAQEVRDYIAAHNLQSVKMHGRFPYNQVGDILRQSDILLLPLIANEGIEKTEPLKLQSYLHAGKPIFGVLRGSCRDIIDEYGLGLCARPDDIDDIACGFADILAFAKQQGDHVRTAAAELLETRFKKERIIQTITETLEKCIAKQQ